MIIYISSKLKRNAYKITIPVLVAISYCLQSKDLKLSTKINRHCIKYDTNINI